MDWNGQLFHRIRLAVDARLSWAHLECTQLADGQFWLKVHTFELLWSATY